MTETEFELVAMTQIPKFQTADMFNRTLLGMHSEAFVFVLRGVYRISYIFPGSPQIADVTIKGFENEHDW